MLFQGVMSPSLLPAEPDAQHMLGPYSMSVVLFAYRNQVTDVFRGVMTPSRGRVAIRVPHDFPAAGDLAGLHTTVHFFVAVRRFDETQATTSKRLPSVPDTPSEQPLVLLGWCCCCLLRSCVVPLWMTSCCPAPSAHT